jgi:uncharacterized coiled-coil protein SlyX
MTIQESVANKIAESGPRVQEAVVNRMADVKINARVDTLEKAVVLQDKLEKELKKVNRNDVTTYVGEAREKVESMSENRFKEIKKAEENLTNLTNALNAALESNTEDSYTKLTEAVAKLGNSKKED